MTRLDVLMAFACGLGLCMSGLPSRAAGERAAGESPGDAYAAFKKAELEFRQFEAIRLELPPARLRRNLHRKLSLRSKLEKAYQAVMSDAMAREDTRLAVACLVRLAQVNQLLAGEMASAPAPRSLTDEQAAIYRSELERQVLPLREKAKALFEKALARQGELGAQDEWIAIARQGLESLESRAGAPDAGPGEKRPDRGS